MTHVFTFFSILLSIGERGLVNEMSIEEQNNLEPIGCQLKSFVGRLSRSIFSR